jgi:mono/diheme cytochrome c family protein
MGKKRPDRSARRARERAARKLVRDRERLVRLSPGGSPDRPIAVGSPAVVEAQARSLPCVQCEGRYQVLDHQAPEAGLRAVDVRCAQCHATRRLWFRISPALPN